MVEAIIEKGGNYCIALKGYQDSLLSDVRGCLAQADDPKAKKKHPVIKTEVVEAKGLPNTPSSSTSQLSAALRRRG
jgi:hypothetical protein